MGTFSNTFVNSFSTTQQGTKVKLFYAIPEGFSHPMLPNLSIKKVGSVAEIQNISINDFRATVTTIKYVDEVSGVDTNSGDTEALAYKTLNKAMQVACDRIVLVTPTVYWTLQSTSITTNKEIISPNGNSVIGKGVTGKIKTWVSDGGGMYHTTTWTIALLNVCDVSVKDINGVPSLLTAVANSTIVATTPNSYFHDTIASILYINCIDGRVPDINIFMQTDQFSCGSVSSQISVYFEGVTLLCGFSITNSSSNLIQFAALNCIMSHQYRATYNLVRLDGKIYSWLKNCICSDATLDCISYKKTTNESCGVEENVISLNAGINGATGVNNASTSHDGSIVLRVNGNYSNSEGPVVHDVNTSKSLNINCVAGESVSTVAENKSSFAVGAASGERATMWLDSCTGGTETTFGAENRADGTAHIYAKKSTISNIEAGTIVESYQFICENSNLVL